MKRGDAERPQSQQRSAGEIDEGAGNAAFGSLAAPYEIAANFYGAMLEGIAAVSRAVADTYYTSLNNLTSAATGSQVQSRPLLSSWYPRAPQSAVPGSRAETLYFLREDPALWHSRDSTAIASNNYPHLTEHLLRGDYKRATAYNNRIRDEAERFGPRSPLVAQTSHNAGWLYASQGQWREAFDAIHQAVGIDDVNVAHVLSINDEKEWLESSATYWKRLSRFLSVLIKLKNCPEARRAGLDHVLRRKAIVHEVSAILRNTVLHQRHPELREQLTCYQNKRMKLGRLQVEHPADHGIDRLETELKDLHEELLRDVPELNREIGFSFLRADRHSLANKLPADSVLVEFIRFNLFNFNLAEENSPWGAPRYAAFVLPKADPDDVRFFVFEAESLEIDQAIEKFRAAIIDLGRNRTFKQEIDNSKLKEERIAAIRASGVKLRKIIFDPLLDAIGGCHRLFLAPDGDLNRLPFEALPFDDSGFVIDRYLISYLGCGRDLLRFGEESSGQPGAPIVAADPDYDLIGTGTGAASGDGATRGRHSKDLDRNERFKPLKGAREEGEEIAKLLGVEPLLGAEVLESELKRNRSPWILHLATHGGFIPDQKPDYSENKCKMERQGLAHLATLENPLLRSFLALSGVNSFFQHKPLPEDAEDGMLNGEDVLGMDLIDTELVVLSACETAVGQVHVGEGVFGLRRAFTLAGAKTLVMSLWEVPDDETRQLMEALYKAILAGKPRAEALLAAQLKIKQDYPDDPLYWGAFICQGKPGPLAQSARG